MAKKKKEEVVEKTTDENVTKVNLSEKQAQEEDNVIKVNLDKPIKKEETVLSLPRFLIKQIKQH